MSRWRRSARSSTGFAGWPVDAGRILQYGLRIHVITRDTSERSVGRGRPVAGGRRPGGRRAGAGEPGAQRIRRPAPHAGLARRQQQPAGGRAQPVGRGGPGTRWSGHRPGRLARRGRRKAGRIRANWASATSSCRDIRTWKRPTGSARACCRCWSGWACGAIPTRQSQPAAATPFAVASAH